jgi:etoposide-induced 2.4 mRNA
VDSRSCRDAEIRANVLKSLMLNSVSLISIYTFDLLMLPLTRNQQRWLHRNVGWFYQVLWLLPVVGLSFYLNVRVSLPGELLL